MPRLSALILAVLAGFSTVALADLSNFQAHIRDGMVDGSFTGDATGGFQVNTSLEGEAEYLYSDHFSFFSQATVALQPSTGSLVYTFMGVGQKYYFLSRSGRLDTSDDGVSVELTPKWRYFGEWMLGVSQIQIESVTSTISVQSTVLEYGVGLGTIYQVTKDVGVELTGTVSKGLAISSVAVDSLIFRTLVGAAISF